MSKKTILFIESSLTGGGSAVSLNQLLSTIDRTKINPVVVFLNNHPQVKVTKDLGIKVYMVNDWLMTKALSQSSVSLKIAQIINLYFLRIIKVFPFLALYLNIILHFSVILKIKKIIRSESPSIVHLNVQILRDLFGLVAASSSAIPCISYLRSMPSQKIDSPILNIINKKTTKFIANSQFTADSWVKYGIQEDKISVVHNVVDISNIETVELDNYVEGTIKDKFVVGLLAPLRGIYKVDEFAIDVFNEFHNHFKDSVLLIIGDGPVRNILENKVEKLNLQDSVFFLGYQQKALTLLKEFDVSLVLNHQDTLSRVAIESLHVGTILLASDVGGIRELVVSEENGFLINHGDLDEAVNVLKRVKTDAIDSKMIIKNGKKTVSDNFNILKNTNKICNIYSQVLK
ncbi:MAG: hypothetical protein CL751_00730 [Chloroflexi bacterium]|nr:hypothetical protein [Chloroflexota bacterium]